MLHPLLSFPPRVQWSTTAEMLIDVFRNASGLWHQDFLLRTKPMSDLQLLASPEILSKAMAFAFKVNLDLNMVPGASQFVADVVTLCVPTHFVGNVIGGIFVESSAPEGKLLHWTQTPNEYLSHFIYNASAGTNINVSFRRKSRTVQVKFFSSRTNVHAILIFQLDAFMAAFDELSGAIDFNHLESALMVADVAEINRESPRAVALLPKSTGNSMKINIDKYDFRKLFALGNHHSTVVRATYTNGLPFLVGPMYFQTSCNDGLFTNVIEHLSSWAITDRASLLVPVIPNPLVVSENSRSSEEITPVPVTASLSRAVQIAPRPQLHEGAKKSFAEEMEAKRLERIEIRKQRNRESAKRSYDSKRQQLRESNRTS